MKNPDQEIIAFIREIRENKNNRIVIVPHVSPDGDAIGSSMALFEFFSNTNIVDVIAPSNFPEFLEWMPDSEKVINGKDNKGLADKLISQANLIIIADHNAANRSGDLEDVIAQSSAKKLMIDHHPEPSYPVDYQISCIKVSSTSELVYNFISDIEPERLDIRMASAIYVGIMTDTGNFMHNVHPDTFKIVSELIAVGIDRDNIYNHVFNTNSIDRMHLLGYALSEKMEVIPELSTAIIALDIDELKRFNYKVGDTEGFVNMPLSIKGINASILVMNRDNEIKISFRSKGNISINKIAKDYFSGGGHKNAAGGVEKLLNMEETLIKLKNALNENKAILLEN